MYSRISLNSTQIVFLLCAIGLIGVTSYFVGIGGVTYQMVISLAILFGVLYSLLSPSIQPGLLVWVGGFALGYRTLSFGEFRLHPLSLMIAMLFLRFLFDRMRMKSRTVRLPALAIVFGLFLVWGLIIGYVNDISLAIMLNDFVNTAIIIPIFIIVQTSLGDDKVSWKRTATVFFCVAGLIALSGIIETALPDFMRNVIPGLILSDQTVFLAGTGFTRSVFAFWGSPAAVFICVLALPFAFVIYQLNRSLAARASVVLIFVLIVIAVYLSGYRSAWIIGILGLILIVLLNQGLSKGGVILAVAGILFVPLVPEEGVQRFGTLTEVFGGSEIRDSSLLQREFRSQQALSLAIEKPWGSGWGASGWTHNDPVQFAANLGLLAAMVFIFWYGQTLWLSVSIYRKHRNDAFMPALIGSFVIAGGLMLFNGLQSVTQLIAPVWFIWAIIDARLRLLKQIG